MRFTHCEIMLAAVLALNACKARSGSETSKVATSEATLSEGCQFADLIWHNIYGSRYLANVSVLPPMKGQLNSAFEVFKTPDIAGKTFRMNEHTRDGEEIPRDEKGRPQRNKAIHAMGTVARIRFEATENRDNPYTGFFKSGAKCGLIRLSLGVKPSADGIVPGAALKFYVSRDKNPKAPRSVNLQVMNQLDPSPDYNFFAEPFSNLLPPPVRPELIAGEAYFRHTLKQLNAVNTDPKHLPLDHLAAQGEDGVTVTKAKAPYRVTFVPTKDIEKLMKDATIHTDFRVELTRLTAGTKLFDVFIDDTSVYHTFPFGGHAGSIVITSEFVASSYGDEALHFMHHTVVRR